MKKNLVLFTCATLALTTSCSQSEILEVVEQQEITVNSFLNKTSANTRTSIGDLSKSNYEIGVTAYKQKGKATATIAFTNAKATETGANVWSFSPAQYWDSAFDTYFFYGYTPYSESAAVSEDRSSLTYPGFTVAEAKDAQKDLMIADIDEVTTGESVSLNFRHMLANINYKVMMGNKMKANDTAKVSVFKADFTQIHAKGDLKYTYATTTPATIGNAVWVNLLGQATTYTDNDTTTITGPKDSYAVTPACDLLMIPQAGELTASLTFDLNGQTFERTIDIRATWEANKRYTYTIVIGAHDTDGDGDVDTDFEEITFETTVVKFDEQPATEHPVEPNKPNKPNN